MAVRVAAATIAETNDTSNTTTYASGSFTPVANRLYLLAVVHSDTAPEATVPTVTTTTGLAFVQVGSSIAFDTIASNVHRITLFRAMKSSGLSNGTYTVTLADAGTGAASVLIEVTQVVTTGTDGADAVRNISTNNADAGANPSITMAGAFASNNNGIAAFFGFDSQTAATASNEGWTVVGDASYNTPATGVTALWRGANNATAVCTHGSADWAGIAVELVSEAVPEIQVPQPPPPPKRKAALAAAILAGSCFFAPLPIETPSTATAAAGGDGQLTAPRVVQYEALAGPVTSPAAVQATPTGWDGVFPVRLRGPARPTSDPAQAVAPLYVPDVTAVVPAGAWRPTYPDRLSPSVRLAAAGQLALAWAPDTPTVVNVETGTTAHDAGALGRPLVVQYVGHAGPVVVPVVAPAAPDRVAPVYPDRVARPVVRRAAYTWAQPMFGVVVEVPVMAWTGTAPDQIPRARPAVEGGRVEVPRYVPDVTAPVTALSWKGTQADRVPAKPGLLAAAHQAFAFDRFQAPGAVVAPDLSWQRIQPDAVVRRTRLTDAPEPVAPLYVPDVTAPVPALSWKGSQPDAVPDKPGPRTAHQRAFAFDRFDPPGTIVAPDLSWQRAQPDLVVRRLRLTEATEPVAPLFVPDVTQPVTALAWKGTQPDRLERATRLRAGQQQAWAGDRFSAPGTNEAPDLVLAVYPDTITRLKPHAARAPFEARDRFDAPAPPVVVPLSWRAIYADRVDRRPTRAPATTPFRAELSPTAHTTPIHRRHRQPLNVPRRALPTAPEREVVQAQRRSQATVPARTVVQVPYRPTLDLPSGEH